jgi:hypothetical protein
MSDGTEEAGPHRHQGSGSPNHGWDREKEAESDQAEAMEKPGEIGGFAEVHTGVQWFIVDYIVNNRSKKMPDQVALTASGTPRKPMTISGKMRRGSKLF